MNVRLMLAAGLLLASSWGSAKAADNSDLSITVDAEEPTAPVHFIVTDPQGRRTGRVSANGDFFKEIPNSSYHTMKLADNSDDPMYVEESEKVHFGAGLLQRGVYRVAFHASRDADFWVKVASNDLAWNDTSPSTSTIKVTLAAGGAAEYQVTVDPTLGGTRTSVAAVESDNNPIIPLACVERPGPKGHWGYRHGHHKFRGHRRRHPFLHHRHPKKDKDWVAVFGYENKNNSPVEIAVGQDNKFSPSPEDRGQTETFEPGLVEEAFEVPFDKKESLMWTVKGPDGQVRNVTADKRSPECN